MLLFPTLLLSSLLFSYSHLSYSLSLSPLQPLTPLLHSSTLSYSLLLSPTISYYLLFCASLSPVVTHRFESLCLVPVHGHIHAAHPVLHSHSSGVAQCGFLQEVRRREKGRGRERGGREKGEMMRMRGGRGRMLRATNKGVTYEPVRTQEHWLESQT